MPKERTIPFGDFKGMTVTAALNQDPLGVKRLIAWLEKNYDPHHKFAAQNRALIDEMKQKLAGAHPERQAATPGLGAPSGADSGDVMRVFRELNTNIQVLINLLAQLNKKLGPGLVQQPATDEYGADMEIPF